LSPKNGEILETSYKDCEEITCVNFPCKFTTCNPKCRGYIDEKRYIAPKNRTAWIVVTNKSILCYADQNKVFSEDNFELAIEWAKSIGYEDSFGLGIDNKIGVLNFYQEGEYKVGIMHIDII